MCSAETVAVVSSSAPNSTNDISLSSKCVAIVAGPSTVRPFTSAVSPSASSVRVTMYPPTDACHGNPF